jgi:hypothetical protein
MVILKSQLDPRSQQPLTKSIQNHSREDLSFHLLVERLVGCAVGTRPMDAMTSSW